MTDFQTFLNFSRKKNRWNLKIYFLKLVHRKGCYGEIKKKIDFSSLIFDSQNILVAPLKEPRRTFGVRFQVNNTFSFHQMCLLTTLRELQRLTNLDIWYIFLCCFHEEIALKLHHVILLLDGTGTIYFECAPSLLQ